MSFTTAMLKQMREEGLSLDACIRVFEAGEPERSSAAERQARYRKNKKGRDVTNGDVTRDVTPPLNERDNLIPCEVSEAEEASSPQPRPWSLPVGLSLQVWTDLLTNRKRKRLPNTPTAWAKFQTDLAAIAAQTGIPPPKIIEMCVAKGWGAIYDPTEDQGHGRSTNGMGRHQPDDGLSSTTRAAISVFGPPSISQSR